MAIAVDSPGSSGSPPTAVVLPVWPALWLTVVLAAAVAMGEVNRLVADVLTTSGASWSFTGTFGPARALNPTGGLATWEAWRTLGGSFPMAALLNAYLVADLFFIVGIAGAVLCAVRSRVAVIVLALALVADAVEAVAALCALYARTTWWASVIGFITLSKWLMYAALIWALGRWVWEPDNRAQLRRIGYGLVRQRFSVLALLPIAALGIAPGSDLLDQLPDVERRWLDDRLGRLHGIVACAAMAALAVALFVLGRLRSDRIQRRANDEKPNPDTAPKPVWPMMALAAVVVTVFTWVVGGGIRWWAAAAVVVMFLAALVSWRLRRRKWHKDDPNWDYEKDRVRTVIGIGDVLAVLAIVIAGIGLVRAFVAPLVLALSPSEASGGLSTVAWPAGCVVLGFGVAVLAWPIAAAVLRRLHYLAHHTRPRRLVEVITPGLPAPKNMTRARARHRTWIRGILVFVALVLLAVLGIVPYQAAAWTGVIACVVLAVTGLVTVLGVVVVVSQERAPLQLFSVMGLRTTPVVTLIFVAAALTWLQSGDAGLHGIQEIDKPSGAADRPTLDAAFAQWMAASGACDSYVAVQTTPTSRRQVRLRPMVLVAAEGGGIRAAYWTASALEKMTNSGTGDACGRQAVFVSSGISGGSLGLAIAATNTEPGEAAGRVSAPDALGAAALGLLVRDDFAAVTDFHLPTLDRAGAPGWQDRAALMETIWQQQAPGLQKPFLGGGPTATGQLILNSTSVGTGCRVLVSQIHLDNPTDPAAPKPLLDTDPPCRSGAAVAPSTFDLLTNYTDRTSSSGDRCVHGLRMATAAMLSARFTYVTPSGVIGPCNHYTTQQLIDGGYAEGTGLGTLIDLAPRWLGLVRGTNATALAALQTPQATPPVFVAPIVVLLKNSSGSDITPSTSKLTTEIQVPLRGREAKTAQTDTNTLLQRAAQLTDPAVLCPVAASDLCTQLTSAARTTIPRPVILVTPDTTPSITAPLGWTLSQASRTTLNTALNDQSTKPCSAVPETATCGAGYGRLADLLAELYKPEPAWLWTGNR